MSGGGAGKRRLIIWTRPSWWLVTIVLGVFALVVIGLALSIYQAATIAPLIVQDSALEPGETRIERERELLQLQSDNLSKIWTIVAQVLAGVVLAVGAVATWRNLQVAQDNLRLTQDRLDVDREAQITNRFTQAIGHLGAVLNNWQPNLEIRVGGIYALGRIASDSPRDYLTIIELLTDYVRHNVPGAPGTSKGEKAIGAPGKPKPPADVQAALTVLGRRRTPAHVAEPGPLDLHGLDLSGADLVEAGLRCARVEGSRLDWADLTHADLRGANLERAHLRNAQLRFAWMGLGTCQLSRHGGGQGEIVAIAGTKSAIASGASSVLMNLETNLRNAQLDGANLERADVGRTHLEGASVKGTACRTAENLTQGQLAKARDQGRGALLPDDWPTDWRDHWPIEG